MAQRKVGWTSAWTWRGPIYDRPEGDATLALRGRVVPRLSSGFVGQLRQERERFDRCQCIRRRFGRADARPDAAAAAKRPSWSVAATARSRRTLTDESSPRTSCSPFEQSQHLARALDHVARQPGEPADLDSVRSVGAAGLQPMQEQDLLAGFTHRDVEVAERVELVGKLRQFMVVRREHGLAANRVVQVLRDRPCDRHAVVRRRAAPDLVEAARGCARSPCAGSRSSRSSPP